MRESYILAVMSLLKKIISRMIVIRQIPKWYDALKKQNGIQR